MSHINSRYYPKIACIALAFLAQNMWSADILALSTRGSDETREILAGLREVCAGKVEIAAYDMKGDPDIGKRILRNLKRNHSTNNPCFIFTMGAPATRLAREEVPEIPLLYSMVLNPDKKGFTGANVGGIDSEVPIKVQLQQLQQLVPSAQNIGVIFDPRNSEHKVAEASSAAAELGLTLVTREVSSHKKVPRAMRSLVNHIDALLLVTDSTVINNDSFQFVIVTTLENRIPTIAYTPYLVKAGFLCSVTPEYASVGRQAGKIFCNNKIDSRPGGATHPPAHFRLSINLKTALRIGVDVPHDALAPGAQVFN